MYFLPSTHVFSLAPLFSLSRLQGNATKFQKNYTFWNVRSKTNGSQTLNLSLINLRQTINWPIYESEPILVLVQIFNPYRCRNRSQTHHSPEISTKPILVQEPTMHPYWYYGYRTHSGPGTDPHKLELVLECILSI